jgi:hypothetical protein
MLAALIFVPALVLQAPGAVKPMWISVLPTQPGRVYGLGVAPVADSDALAVRQASDNGRADVLSRLRANVKSDTQITTSYQQTQASGGVATGTRTQNAQIATDVQAQAADLPGLVVEETYLDRAARTSYALAYLDLTIAERELGARLDAITADLAAPRGETGTRAKLVEGQALKRNHASLVQLDDLSALVSGGGGNPALRAEVLRTRQDTERRMVALRSALTFGLAPSPGAELDADVKAVVRTAVLKEGMGWSDQTPLFSITVRARTGKNGVTIGKRAWWEHQRAADFIVAQGSLDLTLVDREGQQYETMTLVAKGVGVNEFQADQLLLADYKAKLGKAVAAWLDNLAKW